MNRTDVFDLLRGFELHGEVMKAFASGADIQRRVGDDLWEDVKNPRFLLSNEYRIKPKKPLQIPWNLIDGKYQWAAKNSGGNIVLFENKPYVSVGFWVPQRTGTSVHLPLVNIDPDNIPWEESLVQRPTK